MKLDQKKILGALAVVALAATTAICAARCAAPTYEFPEHYQGGAVSGGGGIGRVVTTGTQFTGSGTSVNPLGLSLSVTSPVSGTGSSGDPLTSSGDISAVTAGSGLTGGASSGAATLAVNAGSGITADGTSTRVNKGNGLAFSGGALVVQADTGISVGASGVKANLAGGTCSNDQGVTSVSSTGTATCGTVGRNAYGGTHFELSDDFISFASGITSTAAPIDGMWMLAISGGGINSNAVAITRPGICELTTSTSATGRAALYGGGLQAIDFGSGNWEWEWVGGFPILSTSTEGYAFINGFADSFSTVDQTDGCYFLYDERNVASAPATGANNSSNLNKWSCVCASNSVRTQYVMDGSVVSDGSFTTVNAPIAALTLPNTNIQHLKITMTGATQADFYVNGVKSCQITTHIPSGSSRVTGYQMMQLKSVGTTARVVDTDWARVAVDLTSARSP